MTENGSASKAAPGFQPAAPKAAAGEVTHEAVNGESNGGVGSDFGTKTVNASEEPTVHTLAQSGDTIGLQALFDKEKFDVNSRDDQDVTPLHWAAINANVGACQWLLDHGAEIDPIGGKLKATPLQWAARNGHLYILHLLLRHSADPNIRDSQGFNTLHLVTHSSVVMALLYMLHQPVVIDEKDRDGHTSLMWAAWQGDAISIDILLKNGASVHATDNALLTPLHWAAVKGSRACISRLVEAGADLQSREENGKTPKDMADELKAGEPWVAGLRDAGYDETGMKRVERFQESTRNRITFATPTFFLLISFSSCSILPWYSGIPLAFAAFFGMHHFLTRVVLGSKGFGDKVSKSPYFAAVILASLVWVGYAWAFYLLKGAAGELLEQFLFIVSYSLCCFSFYKAITTEPGYTRRIDDDAELKEIIDDLTSKGTFNGTSFCVQCMNKRPLRSKHCRLCNRCTGRFDHHCPWIWNCVGVKNHGYFLSFVLSLVAGIVLFVSLTITYFIENAPEYKPPRSAYLTVCGTVPSLCAAGIYTPFLLFVALWSTLQLSWTLILIITQVWQVCRNMTTLEVSNLGRYGFMGGRGGTSLRDQSGAMARVAGGGGGADGNLRAIAGAGGVLPGGHAQQLDNLGAGAGLSGADEEGSFSGIPGTEASSGAATPDGTIPVTNSVRRGSHGHSHSHSHPHAGHGHSHGGQRKSVLGQIMQVCGFVCFCCAPAMQILGLDRFTKGQAMRGLLKSGETRHGSGAGGKENPFDMGLIKNWADFITQGRVLDVDYTELYDIPLEGFDAALRQKYGPASSSLVATLRRVTTSRAASGNRGGKRKADGGEYELVGSADAEEGLESV